MKLFRVSTPQKLRNTWYFHRGQEEEEEDDDDEEVEEGEEEVAWVAMEAIGNLLAC